MHVAGGRSYLGAGGEAASTQTALIQALWAAAAFAWAITFGLLGFFANLEDQPSPAREYRAAEGAMVGDYPLTGQTGRAVFAYVTGYNTVSRQTSTHPCIAASGADICHQRSAVACPREFRFGTVVEIKGRPYTCEDRTAVKYGSRFDINCDKNESCPHDVAGWAIIKSPPPLPRRCSFPMERSI
jgi:hypothetical protein